MIGHTTNPQQTSYPLKEPPICFRHSEEKADLFINHFCPLPTNADDQDSYEEEFVQEITAQINNKNIDNLSLPFSDQELHAALINLKNKSTWLDRISNTMLTNLSSINRTTFLKTFNLLFDTGFVPVTWDQALVVPIPKPGKPPESVESYRPISLTFCIGKCMEKLLNNRLKWHLEQYGYIPIGQAGFRPGCSTIDQL